jgi:hypothetical protein
VPVDVKRVQAIFLAAVETDDPAQQAAVLDRECATDPELRRRVEALLRAHRDPASVLDRPVVAPPTVTPELLAATQEGTRTRAEDCFGLDFLAPPRDRGPWAGSGTMRCSRFSAGAGSESSCGRSTRCCSGWSL